MDPPEGSQWSFGAGSQPPGKVWYNSGETVTGIPTGKVTIYFRPPPGYYPYPPEAAQITKGAKVTRAVEFGKPLIIDCSNFDGDDMGTSDPALFNAQTREWRIGDEKVFKYGARGSIPVVGDFDGDGKADIGYFNAEKGLWKIKKQLLIKNFGEPGDLPVPGDYDGDGLTDIAYYRPSNSTWYITASSPSPSRWALSRKFGKPGDIPVPGDYDGDGDCDLAVYRPGKGKWFIKGGGKANVHGSMYSIPVPADYDGDGSTDIAVFTPATRTWDVMDQFKIKFGRKGDIPVPGDYDGDGKAEIAYYRSSTGLWKVKRVLEVSKFGGEDDQPLVRGK